MKAIVLLSGGLDSTLAARLIKEQGLELIALNFKTPFCLCDRHTTSGCTNHSYQVARKLGIELKVINVAEDFLKIIKNPKHGFGSNMNPCIDCRILKFRKAKEVMKELGASFIITGEVLGQRPMSQRRQALDIIDKESSLEGLVLRPLSAKLLPETIPEKEGWVDKDKLRDFNGRTRKPQIALAKEFNIIDYPCPAGGCLLTDKEFSKRLRDLLKYQELTVNEANLLKIGRHFRLSDKAKLIVGRDEKENAVLENLAQGQDYLFYPNEKLAGPTCLGRGSFNEELMSVSSRIACYYCDLNGSATAKILFRRIPDKEENTLDVSALEEDKLLGLRI